MNRENTSRVIIIGADRCVRPIFRGGQEKLPPVHRILKVKITMFQKKDITIIN